MTHLARICATLNAVGEVGAAVGSVRDLQGLICAFNRSVLPRRFQLQHKRGEIAFLVGNRRLHRMEHASAREFPWNTPLGPEHRDDVAKALAALCAAAPLGCVDWFPHSGPAPLEGLGIAAADLIDLLGATTADLPDLQTRICEFASLHPDHVEASFLMADDAIAALTGTEEAVERVLPGVSEMLARATEPGCSLTATLETDGVMVLPREPSDEGSILIAGEVGFLGVLVLRDLPVPEAMAQWRMAQVV